MTRCTTESKHWPNAFAATSPTDRCRRDAASPPLHLSNSPPHLPPRPLPYLPPHQPPHPTTRRFRTMEANAASRLAKEEAKRQEWEHDARVNKQWKEILDKQEFDREEANRNALPCDEQPPRTSEEV